MNRFLFAVAASLVAGLTSSTVALAMGDDPPPARPAVQPKAVQVRPVQPAQPGVVRVTPARLATLEEEFETLEAHRDVKKAYVRAAEVAVKGAEASLELMNKPNAIPVTDLMKAKLELEAAKAQLEIRVAELKEVEVKIRHAKKRLDEAKAAPVRNPANPFPKADRKPVDPPPFAAAAEPADDKVVEALKKKVAELEVVAAEKQAAAKKAEAVAKEAKAELARVLDIAMRGRVRPGTIEAAQARADEAKAAAEKAAAEVKKAETELEKVKAKLKEIEK